MKKCNTCNTTKDESFFHKRKASKDGLAAKCKTCCKSYRKKYYDSNRTKAIEYSKRYDAENKERVRRRNNLRYLKNKDKIREKERAKRELEPSGVYKITFKDSGKYYIGCSKSIHSRWNSHLRVLRRGIHENSKVQEQFDLYGEESMLKEIIIQVPYEKLISTEEEIISKNIENELCLNHVRHGHHTHRKFA
jgi:hypothetical protein